MKENKTRMLVLGLIVVIAILLGFVLYLFVLKPSFTGYATKMQNEGVTLAVATIMQGVAPPQCQIIPLTFGDQTINVVAVECLPQSCLQPE